MEVLNILWKKLKKKTGEPISFFISMKKAKSFLISDRIKAYPEKFCRFLPVPIFFEDKQINNHQSCLDQKTI